MGCRKKAASPRTETNAGLWRYKHLTFKDMNKETIVCFHIGRGGRFNNAGYLTFEGVRKINETSDFLNNCFHPRIVQDSSDEWEVDESPEAEWTDGSGNSVELTNAQVASGVGRIEMDGDYDTTYTKKLEDLTEKEIEAVREALPQWDAKQIIDFIENQEDKQ